jgi:periplasmic protein TonB
VVTYDDPMGYQALLFCPDEKTARVVTQVLSDLDFVVDAAGEPFAAVKKLMAQHYDALVVDCENEQNAGLLFRSARNSNANQSSLAVAVVEGQAGVAKAFRIGANLVLTKPINVEQSKGTLRVARGLLRKASDLGKAPATQLSTTSPEQAAPLQRPKPGLVPGKPAPSFVTARTGQESSVHAGASQTPVAALGNATPESSGANAGKRTLLPSMPAAMVPEAEASTTQALDKPGQADASAPNPPFISTVSRGSGMAAAAAPAKQLPGSLLEALEGSSAPATGPAPSFSTLDLDGEKEKGFAWGKILGVFVAMIVIAVAGYFGYKHGNKGEDPATSTAETQTTGVQVPAPASNLPKAGTSPKVYANPSAAPVPSASSTVSAKPSAAPATSSTMHPNVSASKPSPSTKSSSSSEIAEDTTVRVAEEDGAKSEPLKVKPDIVKPAHAKRDSGGEPTVPPAPGALNLGASSSEDKAVSNLVASAPVSVPKPSPEVLNISQGVTQGMILKKVQPVYPQQALSMHVQGAVQLQATIAKDGAIKNVKVLKGDGLLARAAVDAVRQWKYKPYYLNGEPVEIQTEITVNFKLPN